MGLEKARRWKVAAALMTLWLVWGSTYFVVSKILPVVPPFALSASRFLVAAPILGFIAFATGCSRPVAKEVGNAFLVGAFLFLGGNGGTVWSQTRVHSGLTAVVVGCVPLWVGLLGWWVNGERPHPLKIAGMILGICGVAALLGGTVEGIDPVGVLACVGATMSWATGTILARRIQLPSSVLLSTALQMFSGAVLLSVAAGLAGSWSQVQTQKIGISELMGFAWLVSAGSIAALVAYNWLLKVTTSAIATTYAYVNPVVAISLGWAFGGERMGVGAMLACATIIAAVILTTSAPKVRNA